MKSSKSQKQNIAEPSKGSGREIGGYFELEVNAGLPYHPDTLAFDSARSALRYFLRKKQIRRIYLPLYICNAVTEAVQDEGVPYEFYSIAHNFKPAWENISRPDAAILLVNYFGILKLEIAEIPPGFEQVIIDNSQAFFAPAMPGQAAIYSPRKFFGVPDGGYLVSDIDSNAELALSTSYERFGHLLMRSDGDTAAGYLAYHRNENSFLGGEPQRMSLLTEKLLNGIDYQTALALRRRNFLHVHQALGQYNRVRINPADALAPMSYPFLINLSGLRAYLIEQKIYVARFWNEVLGTAPDTSFEYKLAADLAALPIDQRWSLSDMNRIIDCVMTFLLANKVAASKKI
jgi:hypothetical protein